MTDKERIQELLVETVALIGARDAARGIATELEQRLAAVIALCDAQQAWADKQPWARVLLPIEKVRAAAGGVL